MLKSHMDAIEKHLTTISKVPENAGHGLHKGTPREAFIKEFLESHLPSNVAIGSGEIIDANSKPGQKRNQFDIVIYRRSYPKLDFGGNISGFLIESVIATIEVKSTLTKKDFGKAAKAAQTVKKLTPNTTSIFHSGYIPPKVLNYIVAYDGPSNIKTVYSWINSEYSKNNISQSQLPTNSKQRIKSAADAIDAIFILEKGFLYYDNIPMGFVDEQTRMKNPNLRWVFANNLSGNLLLLFLMIQKATANIEGKWLNPAPYLSSFPMIKIGIGD